LRTYSPKTQVKEEQIPYEARLLAVTNAYDAMCFKRSANQSLTTRTAILYLKKMSGKQFDPVMVEGFVQILSDHQKSERESVGPPASGGVTPTDDHRAVQYREYKATGKGNKTSIRTRPILVQELEPGMQIARPLRTSAGAVLLGTETILTDWIIAKLKQLHEQQVIEGPVYISV